MLGEKIFLNALPRPPPACASPNSMHGGAACSSWFMARAAAPPAAPISRTCLRVPVGASAQPDMVEVRRAGDGEGGVELGYAEQCPEGQKGKQVAAGTKRRGEEELVD
ncbi:hypothetical protein MUK42_12844 [Musa troglodytarum]|uniref:Uncharacterized protein n=1 Tax=Musa troglodytarum TaxID=320322 RepID=A0A9E7GM55_9LILI|nr:hypothetical protein MUK42_12844 [Musa troglodytarum]